MQTACLGRMDGSQVLLYHCCHAFSIGYASHYIHVSKTDVLKPLSLVIHRHGRKYLLHFKIESVNITARKYTQNHT